jgi:hypothetical protein
MKTALIASRALATKLDWKEGLRDREIGKGADCVPGIYNDSRRT